MPLSQLLQQMNFVFVFAPAASVLTAREQRASVILETHGCSNRAHKRRATLQEWSKGLWDRGWRLPLAAATDCENADHAETSEVHRSTGHIRNIQTNVNEPQTAYNQSGLLTGFYCQERSNTAKQTATRQMMRYEDDARRSNSREGR